MTNRSHNKKRNVGIIYEQLLATAARGIVESNTKTTSKAKKLISRFYNEDTEIYREHRLFKALIEPHIEDGSLATKILGEAKRAAQMHNEPRLRREKSRLIKEINYSFGKEFYSQKVKDYTKYATVQTLLNDWRNGADVHRIALYESKVHKILTEDKSPKTLQSEQNKEVDNLVVKVMTDKYNEKYGKQLTEVQQMLVKQYVFAENGNSKGFKNMLSRIQETVLRDLTDYDNQCYNSHVASKINEVKEDIRSLDITSLDDQTMTRFLTLCDLSEQLRGK